MATVAAGLARPARALPAALAALDRHFFAPAPLTDIALARIVIFGTHATWFLSGLEYQRGLVAIDDALFRPITALKILLLPLGWGVRPDVQLIETIWVIALVASLLAAAGLLTRLSALTAAAAHTALTAHAYSYGEIHHPEAIATIAMWMLALAPSGAAWSLDALVRGRSDAGPSPHGRWPLRVVQWVLVLAYLSAGLHKLHDGGLAWMNGHTLGYYLIEDGVRYGIPISLEIARYPLALALVSMGAVWMETTFALAVLVPRVTWLYVLAGIGMHASIWFLQQAPFFQWIWCYVVLVDQLRQTPGLTRLVPARFRSG